MTNYLLTSCKSSLKLLLLLFALLELSFHSNATQSVLEKDVSLSFENTKLEQVLATIEKKANIKFIYSSDKLNVSEKISYKATNIKLSEALNQIFTKVGVSYRTHGNKIIITSTKISLNSVEARSITYKTPSFASTVKGKVSDSNGNSLPGVSVSLKGTSRGTTTDTEGNFSLDAATGDIIVFSFVGFESKEIRYTGQANLNIIMSESVSALSEIIVTGTRSGGRTKIDTPVPVDVIPLAQVTNAVAQVDLNQLLTYLAPSFQSSRQTISDGTDHIDPAQLRGLGPDQVLVLINGKRRHQSSLVNVNGTVNRGTVGTDLNAIPASAVEKIEILRDGAAAQYGSDAIAGVINIVLKKQEGLSGNVSFGEHVTAYERDYLISNNNGEKVNAMDGETAQLGLNYGLKVGDKGFVNVTGEFVKRGETNRTGTYTGAVFPAVTGQTDDQVIASKGLTRNDFDMRIGNSAVTSGSIMLNAELPINDVHSIYAFGGYNQKKGNAAGFFRYPSGIPAAVRNNVFAVYPNGFLPEINSDVIDISAAIGLRGKVANWNYDLSNTFGRNSFDFTITNSVNYTQALSSSNFQTEFNAGGMHFLQNTMNLDLNRKFDVLSGMNVAWGGEFRIDQFGITAGEESSYKNYNTSAGVPAGAQVFAGFLPSNEGNFSRNSKAIYVDIEQDITKSLVLTGALRYENFSDFGGTLNYKLATRYKITEGLALRASTSTGFRAPSMQQRFYAKTNTLFVTQNGALVPIESGTFTNDSKAAEILGIPKLKQETSKSYTVGITANIVKGLELTVDAYQIDIKDRIVLTNNFSDGGDAAIKAQLAAANASTANFFTNAVDTRSRGIEAVLAYAKNLGEGKSFKATLAGTLIRNEVLKDANGKPIIHASDILIRTNQVANYFNREDQSRIEVASPREKINLTLNYNVKKFGVMLRGVRFGEVVYLDPTMTSSDKFPLNTFTNTKETLDQTFSPKIVTDLSFNYSLTSNLKLTVGANNLFDVYQDKHTHSSNTSLGRFIYSRRVQQMGFNGRFVFARLNFNF